MSPSFALRDFDHPRLLLGIWLAALAATVVVCLLPMPALEVAVKHVDKFEHAVGYLLLGAYAGMLFSTRRALLGALLALFALGALIELLQLLLPWRSGGDLLDLLANLLGIALGGGIVLTPLATSLQRAERWAEALPAGWWRWPARRGR